MASTPISGKAPAGQGLFTRQSSGLVRELGIPAATAISLASVAVVNTFINFNAGLTAFNQADMTLPLLLGAGIWLVAMFAYKYLLEAIPRAGGEYVYLSRIISPALGAMFGIGICIAFTYILAANANFTAQYFPFLLTALGAAFGSSSISNAASQVTSQTAIATISVVMLLVVGAASWVSLRRLGAGHPRPRHRPAGRLPRARLAADHPLPQRLRHGVRRSSAATRPRSTTSSPRPRRTTSRSAFR